MTTETRRSPLALAILGLLSEEPMHPYRMQRLIKARDKDDVVNVRGRTSLYETIERLARAGLVAVRATDRAERRPERTIYELTDAGRAVLRDWLGAMLATPAREFPEFLAAVAHLSLISPEEAQGHLEQRAARLADMVAEMEAQLRNPDAPPRLFLLELEAALAARRAELGWVRAVIDDLRSGRLAWSAEWLRPYLGQPKDGEAAEKGGPA
jgi:DNA-binding PadR family transcriptional regulator